MTPIATVSVLVCVRDGLPHLDAALASIAAEDDGAVEVVVVDDGSTDASGEVIAAYGLHPIAGPGRGVAAARSTALGVATGELVAFCDQDDLWQPGRLATQRALLDADGTVDAVAGRVVPFLEPGVERPDWVPEDMLDVPRFTPALGSMLIRRRAFDEVGGLDASLRLADDVDWLVRAQEAGRRFVRHPEVVLRYRIHERNQSAARAAMRAEILGALRRSMVRRRTTA